MALVVLPSVSLSADSTASAEQCANMSLDAQYASQFLETINKHCFRFEQNFA
jgi:hypothetical protein